MDWIVIDDRRWFLGCLPRVAKPGEVYPIFGEQPSRTRVHIIPRSEWKPLDFSHLVIKVLDQDGQGACNTFASVQALHVIRHQVGLPFVELSAGNLYGRINGGVDRGSVIADAILELEKNGVCPVDVVPHLEWRQRRWPSHWKEEAKKFRIVEAWDCPTFDHLASAILHGFPVNLSILVGSNFKPDPDGWLPDYRGGGGGHAMCGVGLVYDGKRGWGIKVVNSWGQDWGLNGFAIVPESYFKSSPFTDAWAVRGMIDPKGDL